MRERVPVRDARPMLQNLKRNWWFPISGVACFCTQLQLSTVRGIGMLVVGVLVAGIVLAAWAAQRESVLRRCGCDHWAAKAFFALTALGISLRGFLKANSFLTQIPAVRRLSEASSIEVHVCIAALGAVVGFGFVYVCVACLWRSVHRILKESGLLPAPDRKRGGQGRAFHFSL